MRARLNADGGLFSPGINCGPDYGELTIGGGTAFASASNPTAEVIDGTGVAAGNSSGLTMSATTGLITVRRPGLYLVYLSIGQISSASASGVITLAVQKNTAAVAPRITAKLLQPAVVDNFMSANCMRVVSLTKGDTIRAVVTGTTGGIITIEEGVLGVCQLLDLPAVTVTGE